MAKTKKTPTRRRRRRRQKQQVAAVMTRIAEKTTDLQEIYAAAKRREAARARGRRRARLLKAAKADARGDAATEAAALKEAAALSEQATEASLLAGYARNDAKSQRKRQARMAAAAANTLLQAVGYKSAFFRKR